MTVAQNWNTRSLALVILVLALGVVVDGLVLPIANWIQESEATIVRANESIAKYQSVIASLPGLRDELQRKKREMTSARLLVGSTLPEVNAELQTRVQKIVNRAGASLLGSLILTPIDEQQLSKFAVQVDLRATPEQLAEVTRLTEDKETPLFIDKLEVSVPENGGGQLDINGQPFSNASFQISGYSLIPLDSVRKQ